MSWLFEVKKKGDRLRETFYTLPRSWINTAVKYFLAVAKQRWMLIFQAAFKKGIKQLGDNALKHAMIPTP